MTGLRDGVLLRAMLAATAVSLFVVIAIAINGRIAFHIGGLQVRAHSALTPGLAAFVLALIVAIGGRGELRGALSWWWSTLERRAAAAALVLSCVALAIGITWGTFAAGGSDSYCYLNQAELFARGHLRDVEPLGADTSWPGSADAFVPVGHNPSPAVPGGFVPMCPAGYPILLAATRIAFGRNAMFWVTPLFGALAVWLAFVLGRRVGGSAAGVLAAALTLTSPIFLFQIVQPMNDVVAAALWAAALVSVTRRGSSDLSRGLLSGIITGAALTIRPNLLPLVGVMGMCGVVLSGQRGTATLRGRVITLLAFGVAALPGVLVVLAIQNAMYDSPVRSGYGDLSALFSWSNIGANLVRYARWTTEAHTLLISVALIGPFALRGARREAACMVLFSLATLACYLPYVVFDAWWYQRFLLPGILPLLVLTAAVLSRLVARLEPAGRMVAFVCVLSVLPLLYLRNAVERDAFRLQDFEARFRNAGQYAARLPPESAFITMAESGSVRFYSGRTSAVWLGIEPGRLAEAVDFFRRHGRKPYLLIEMPEERGFRERFAADRLGGLEWPPIVEIDRAVRIYDPADYERYMRGEFVNSERIMTKRTR
ncbi:MAG: glycosyltransferase family 39 protein [Vicinamibacterales bacterium]